MNNKHNKYKFLIKGVSTALVCIFTLTSMPAIEEAHALSPWAGSQRVAVRRAMLERALDHAKVSYADASDTILENSNALLLSHGKILLSPDLKSDSLRKLRAIFHEEIEAVMQILEKQDRARYSHLLNMILSDESIQKTYEKAFPSKDVSMLSDEMRCNDIVASAFEILLLQEEKAISLLEMTKEEKEFIEAIRPAINANKHSYFTGIFWDQYVREMNIRLAMANGQKFVQVAAGKESTPVWITGLFGLEECKTVYQDYLKDKTSVNVWKLRASLAALGENKRKDLFEWASVLSEDQMKFLDKLISDGEYARYLPVYELHPDDKWLEAPYNDEKRVLKTKMEECAARNKVIAHGCANDWFERGRDKLPIRHQWTLLNIILEGKISGGEAGPLTEDGNAPFNSCHYGPYYVVLDEFASEEKVGKSGDYYIKFRKGNSAVAGSHMIYLVPGEASREFLLEQLEESANRGLITEEDAAIAASKIMTYEEFVANEIHIKDIIERTVTPADVIASGASARQGTGEESLEHPPSPRLRRTGGAGSREDRPDTRYSIPGTETSTKNVLSDIKGGNVFDGQIKDAVRRETGREVIEVDITSPEDAVAGLTEGRVVVLDLSSLGGKRGSYDDVYYAIRDLSGDISDVIRGADNMVTMTPVFEAMKNAFSHGNMADFKLPIFVNLRSDKGSGKTILEIYDTASREENEERRIAAYHAELWGGGAGIKTIRNILGYDNFRQDRVRGIGGKATLIFDPGASPVKEGVLMRQGTGEEDVSLELGAGSRESKPDTRDPLVHRSFSEGGIPGTEKSTDDSRQSTVKGLGDNEGDPDRILLRMFRYSLMSCAVFAGGLFIPTVRPFAIMFTIMAATLTVSPIFALGIVRIMDRYEERRLERLGRVPRGKSDGDTQARQGDGEDDPEKASTDKRDTKYEIRDTSKSTYGALYSFGSAALAIGVLGKWSLSTPAVSSIIWGAVISGISLYMLRAVVKNARFHRRISGFEYEKIVGRWKDLFKLTYILGGLTALSYAVLPFFIPVSVITGNVAALLLALLYVVPVGVFLEMISALLEFDVFIAMQALFTTTSGAKKSLEYVLKEIDRTEERSLVMIEKLNEVKGQVGDNSFVSPVLYEHYIARLKRSRDSARAIRKALDDIPEAGMEGRDPLMRRFSVKYDYCLRAPELFDFTSAVNREIDRLINEIDNGRRGFREIPIRAPFVELPDTPELGAIEDVCDVSGYPQENRESKWGRFVPGPTGAIQTILDAVRNEDPDAKICDLGSGNGKACFIAAERGFKDVTGIEAVESLHRDSIDNQGTLGGIEGVSDIKFINGDFFEEDLSGYDVLFFFYTFPIGVSPREFNETLRLKLISETGMKPGARFFVLSGRGDIVSNDEELSHEVFDRRYWISVYTRGGGAEACQGTGEDSLEHPPSPSAFAKASADKRLRRTGGAGGREIKPDTRYSIPGTEKSTADSRQSTPIISIPGEGGNTTDEDAEKARLCAKNLRKGIDPEKQVRELEGLTYSRSYFARTIAHAALLLYGGDSSGDRIEHLVNTRNSGYASDEEKKIATEALNEFAKGMGARQGTGEDSLEHPPSPSAFAKALADKRLRRTGGAGSRENKPDIRYSIPGTEQAAFTDFPDGVHDVDAIHNDDPYVMRKIADDVADIRLATGQYYEAFYGLAPEKADRVALVAEALKCMREDNEKMMLLIEGGRIAGFVSVYIISHPEEEDSAVLAHIAIKKKSQGRGAGSLLMDSAVDTILRHRVRRFHFSTRNDKVMQYFRDRSVVVEDPDSSWRFFIKRDLVPGGDAAEVTIEILRNMNREKAEEESSADDKVSDEEPVYSVPVGDDDVEKARKYALDLENGIDPDEQARKLETLTYSKTYFARTIAHAALLAYKGDSSGDRIEHLSYTRNSEYCSGEEKRIATEALNKFSKGMGGMGALQGTGEDDPADDAEQEEVSDLRRFMLLVENIAPGSRPEPGSIEEQLVVFDLDGLKLRLGWPELTLRDVVRLIPNANKAWQKLDSRLGLVINPENQTFEIIFSERNSAADDGTVAYQGTGEEDVRDQSSEIASEDKRNTPVRRSLGEGGRYEIRDTKYREDEFNEYLRVHDLHWYKPLRLAFMPAVRDALLEDPELKPVFLQVLPDENVGAVTVVEEMAIGGEDIRDILVSHSAFKIGDAETAARAILNGHKIIIGVTDRNSDDNLQPLSDVANGRQAYFPLADGTWLGVKGSGQFIKDVERPFYQDGRILSSGEYRGLAWLDEARAAKEAEIALKGKGGRFVQLLGYRSVYSVPDGEGGFVIVRGLIDRNIGAVDGPALIFNRVASPHRVSKMPQLILSDRGLLRLVKNINKGLIKMGYLPEGTDLSASEMMIEMMRQFGGNEAVKQNALLFKRTIHSQDFTFAGEEADCEEMLQIEEYREFLKEKGKIVNTSYMLQLLDNYQMDGSGIRAKVGVLLSMVKTSNAYIGADEDNLLFPDPLKALEVMMREYFGSLEDRFLRPWTAADPEHPLSWPLIMRSAMPGAGMHALHKKYSRSANDDAYKDPEVEDAHNEIVEMICAWASEEVFRRTTARQGTGEEGVSLELGASAFAKATADKGSRENKSDTRYSIPGIEKSTSYREEGELLLRKSGIEIPVDITGGFDRALEGLRKVSLDEYRKAVLKAEVVTYAHREEGQSLVLYADDILESTAVIDLEKSIKGILAKHSVLSGGKMILYAREEANAVILERMIRNADSRIEIVVVTRDELVKTRNLTGGESDEIKTLVKTARCKGAGDILAVIKGPSSEPEELVSTCAELKVPVILMGYEEGLYSFAAAIAKAILVKNMEGSGGWVVILPPIRTISEDIELQYRDYLHSLQALVAA
ncbi:MAG: GNAT family N-acetyltransferase [Candidatus Tantalella remota]|nr:GNAT family N-acetyltransferase [Candidatus Tantalella remota]